MTVPTPAQLSYCVIANVPDPLLRSLAIPDLADDLARTLSGKRRERDVWASVVGRLLLLRSLRALGARRVGLSDLGCRQDGGPRLPAPFCGSISHNDTMVVAIAAPAGAIGIDIEPRDPVPCYQAAAGAHFSSEERSLLRQDGGGALFARLWTRKEALAKASGSKLEDLFALPVLADDPVVDRRLWRLHSLELGGTQQCAIAFDRRSLDLRLDEMSVRSLLALLARPARRG